MGHTLNLTAREAQIAALHYVDEQPQAAIAEWLGVHIQTVKQCCQRAVRKHPELKRLRRKPDGPVRVLPFSSVARNRAEPVFSLGEL